MLQMQTAQFTTIESRRNLLPKTKIPGYAVARSRLNRKSLQV